MSPGVGAVVVAAGSGRRFGGRERKQYQMLSGEPILLRALRPFLEHPRVAAVVVVLPAEDADSPPSWLAATAAIPVAGGAERHDSVRTGLAALPADVEVVLVHDGARPLVESALIDRVLAASGEGRGVVPTIAVTDTIKEVDDRGRVVGTPARRRLRRAQTPQAFPLAALRDAYRPGAGGTDDAEVFAEAGGEVRVVEGSTRNLKITDPLDLHIAELLLEPHPRGTGQT